MKETAIIIILAVVVLAVVAWQMFQFATFKEKMAGLLTGNVVGELDTSGWSTDEIMNYEMHGTIPARISSGALSPKAAGPAMVGGC